MSRIRTCEGPRVKRTVLWTVRSAEREAGTKRAALGRRSGQYTKQTVESCHPSHVVADFVSFATAFLLKSHLSLTPSPALLRYPKFLARVRFAEFRPLRQQILPASATGSGRMCCPFPQKVTLGSPVRL